MVCWVKEINKEIQLVITALVFKNVRRVEAAIYAVEYTQKTGLLPKGRFRIQAGPWKGMEVTQTRKNRRTHKAFGVAVKHLVIWDTAQAPWMHESKVGGLL